MASPENILLYLPQKQEDQVRQVFARLAQRGFPAQQQTPHITITFAPSMEPAAVEYAASVLPPLIPAQFRRVGTVVFGTKRKHTVAWLLEASDALEIAAREISALNPAGRGPRWTPHLTMGLRLPRAMVPEYLQALDDVTPKDLYELTAQRAGYWQPQHQNLRILAP